MAVKATFLDAPTNEWVDILQSLAITLTAPTSGTFVDGALVTVTWVFANLDSQYRDPNNLIVKLDRNNAGTFATTLEASIDGNTLTTSFNASPTPGLANDTKVRIRIYDAQDNDVLATSNYLTFKTKPVKSSFNGTWTVAG